MVFVPIKYLGIGIKHLHTLQEIARLKDIMMHTHKNTTTGKLYRQTTENLFLEIGTDTSFTSLDFPSLDPIATPSLIKSTWQFLHENNLDLKHDIEIPDQRLNDRTLMSAFKNSNASLDELISLNRCRLFL